ncbi:MAG: hypothetical protein AAGA86_14320, partial [Bacteroidota bacterium]
KSSMSFLGTPLFWLLVLLALVGLTTFIDFKRKKRSAWLDTALFALTGLAGCLLFFLWFLTDHTATAINFNLLWAFPLNLGLPFLLFRKAHWFKNYVRLLLGLLGLLLLLGLFGIQGFSPLLLPLVLALGIRYFFIFLFFPKPEVS